jgi:hypothetical protein
MSGLSSVTTKLDLRFTESVTNTTARPVEVATV